MGKFYKKTLSLCLITALTVSGITLNLQKTTANSTLPEPLSYFDFEKGFRGDNLDVMEVGYEADYVEYLDENSRKPLDNSGRATGEYVKSDTVFINGTWSSGNGYTTEKIPGGKEKQLVPAISSNDGTFFFNATANQATTAYDENTYKEDGSVDTYGKGNVFWMGSTYINQSYPTYATTVDWENGTYETDANILIRDTQNQATLFGINNSATLFESPLKDTDIDNFTLSAWVKNTNVYTDEVVYENEIGNVNSDTAVDANDALDILKHVAKISLLSGEMLYYADVNNSENVDANDALDVLKYVARIISEFTKKIPATPPSEEIIEPLENTEFFHFEKRDESTDSILSVLDRTNERGYLYFTANSIVFVPDYTDITKTCIWTLSEDLQGDAYDLLNAKNGGIWHYITYSFDGNNFHLYVNGQERALECKVSEGYSTASTDIISFITASNTEGYLGGLGGGMKDNFNTFYIETNEDYYMDDVAIYDTFANAETATKLFNNAATQMEAAQNRTVNRLKTYKLDGPSLDANELTAVSGSDSSILPVVAEDTERGTVLQTSSSYQSAHGGAVFSENPFAGKKDLTGVTVSYWMKAIGNKRGNVTDGVLLSFINDPQECYHEKLADAYLGDNSIARSQLAINAGFLATFCEGQSKPIGANSLMNTYSFRPYTIGDSNTLPDYLQIYAEPSWTAYKEFLKSLDDKWYFVTLTLNNSGIKMYIDGEEVINQCISFYGATYYDSCYTRIYDAFKNGTNNPGSRSMMDIITDETTKVYIGYAFEQGTDAFFQKSTNCYIDEISFYDADMNSAEIKTLYQSVSK